MAAGLALAGSLLPQPGRAAQEPAREAQTGLPNGALQDRLAPPLVHLAATPGVPGARAVAPVLLGDPAVRALLTRAGLDAGSTLDHLRQLLDTSTGEFELFLTDVFPGGATGGGAALPDGRAVALPLMIARARLEADAAASIAESLEGGVLARPYREINGHRTFALRGADDPRPGRLVEVALAGLDLVVGNHATAMEDALGAVRTTARAAGVDPGLRALRERLGPAPPGAVDVALDWRRLAQRFIPATDALAGLCGLDGVQHVVLRARPGRERLETSILAGLRDGPRGLLAAVVERPLRRLVAALPAGERGALAVALDPARIATRGALRSGPRA
jgi:hypothetical protein